MTDAATPMVEAMATRFARVLRAHGLAVPLDSVAVFVDALARVGLDRRNPVYWAGRATLVRRQEDIAVYDRVFAEVFDDAATTVEPTSELETVRVALAHDDAEADGDSDTDHAETADDSLLTLRFSAAEVLRSKDFSAYSDTELLLAQQLMARLRLTGRPRRSLRLKPERHRTSRPDLRRTVAASLRSGGEPIERRWRDSSERPRRLVILLDVSGSMEPYARALVRFVHAAVVGRQRVEAFALGTRLTRITRELASRDPDHALRRASERVADWSGGTRLGDGLRRFNDEWGVRGMARGAVVVILSDGWDRGDPALVSEQMARLARVAHTVIWVNPLKVTPGYAPLARGMAAALPFVDHFVEGHSIEALEHLAAVIAGQESSGSRPATLMSSSASSSVSSGVSSAARRSSPKQNRPEKQPERERQSRARDPR